MTTQQPKTTRGSAIGRIVARAAKLHHTYNLPFDNKRTTLRILKCHKRQPLRLTALAKADDFNLMHDVVGILQHCDARTGRLDGCFMPRYTR